MQYPNEIDSSCKSGRKKDPLPDRESLEHINPLCNYETVKIHFHIHRILVITLLLRNPPLFLELRNLR